MKSLRTASFHPQTNSPAELKKMSLIIGLRAYLFTGKADWANRLQTIAFLHNFSQVPCTRTGPYALVLNRQPHLAVGARVLEAARKSGVPAFSETFMDSFEIMHDAITQDVLENSEIAQKHQFA